MHHLSYSLHSVVAVHVEKYRTTVAGRFVLGQDCYLEGCVCGRSPGYVIDLMDVRRRWETLHTHTPLNAHPIHDIEATQSQPPVHFVAKVDQALTP